MYWYVLVFACMYSCQCTCMYNVLVWDAKKDAAQEEQVKRVVETRWCLKADRPDSNEACLWMMFVSYVPVRTTYQYVPVCTRLPEYQFFYFDIIISYPLHTSCMLLYLALSTLSGWWKNHMSVSKYVLPHRQALKHYVSECLFKRAKHNRQILWALLCNSYFGYLWPAAWPVYSWPAAWQPWPNQLQNKIWCQTANGGT